MVPVLFVVVAAATTCYGQHQHLRSSPDNSFTPSSYVLQHFQSTNTSSETSSTQQSTSATPSLSSQLKDSCIAHRQQFDQFTKIQTQLVLDLFFVAFNTPLLPAGGTLLGTIRHRLLCAPWDDDLDFNIPTDEYDRLLSEDTPMKTNSKHVIDISQQHLGQTFAEQIRKSSRCMNDKLTPEKQCPKIVTLAVEDPGPIPQSEEAVFFHQYFEKSKSLQNNHKRDTKDDKIVCLSILFLNFGFFKVLAHDECSINVLTEPPSVPFKITDVFPLSFSTWSWTCPYSDYASGVPSPRCSSRALYAQPVVTSTARMVTVEEGGDGDGVRLLVPLDVYSKFFLKGNYGRDVFAHAMVCPHTLYSCYEKCAKVVTPTSMTEIRALMSEIPECYGYDGDGTSGENIVTQGASAHDQNSNEHADAVKSRRSIIISNMRDQLYLRVAKLSIEDHSEGSRYWKDIYYYENVPVDDNDRHELKTDDDKRFYATAAGSESGTVSARRIRMTRQKTTLPAPGILSLANFESVLRVSQEYGSIIKKNEGSENKHYNLFWTDEDRNNIVKDEDGSYLK
jgi:hypothetical protein